MLVINEENNIKVKNNSSNNDNESLILQCEMHQRSSSYLSMRFIRELFVNHSFTVYHDVHLIYFTSPICVASFTSSYIRHRFIISVFHKFMMILCLPHVHTNNQLKAFFHTILWVWHSTWLEHWTSFEISTMSSPVQWVLPITIHAISFKPCSSADTKAISEQWTSANIQGLFDSL